MSRVYLFRVEHLFPYPPYAGTNADWYLPVYACKIGLVKSDDIKRVKERLRTCQTNNPWKISLEACSEPMSLEEARFVEDYYSRFYYRENMHGEWFAIIPNMLDKLKKEIEIAHTLRERRAQTHKLLKGIFEHG